MRGRTLTIFMKMQGLMINFIGTKNDDANDANFSYYVDMKRNNIIIHLNSARDEEIHSNRFTFGYILKTRIYCSSYDRSFCGKLSQSGKFEDLIDFRVGSSEIILEDHLRTLS